VTDGIHLCLNKMDHIAEMGCHSNTMQPENVLLEMKSGDDIKNAVKD